MHNNSGPSRSFAYNYMFFKHIYFSSFFRCVFLAIAGTCLAGCVNIISAVGSFPVPPGEKMPLTIALYFAEEFRNYAPVEDLYQKNDWQVNLGIASTQMFSQVFSNISRDTVILDKKPGSDSQVAADLIVVPSITDFGLLDPAVTPLDFFSMSFKYRVDIFTPDGALLDEWTFNAYGKTASRVFGDKESVRQALLIALRDAAASLTLDFSRRPGVRGLLMKTKSKTIAEANQDVANN